MINSSHDVFLAAATDGDSLPANLALAEHNAEIAAHVAVAIAQST